MHRIARLSSFRAVAVLPVQFLVDVFGLSLEEARAKLETTAGDLATATKIVHLELLAKARALARHDGKNMGLGLSEDTVGSSRSPRPRLGTEDLLSSPPPKPRVGRTLSEDLAEYSKACNVPIEILRANLKENMGKNLASHGRRLALSKDFWDLGGKPHRSSTRDDNKPHGLHSPIAPLSGRKMRHSWSNSGKQPPDTSSPPARKGHIHLRRSISADSCPSPVPSGRKVRRPRFSAGASLNKAHPRISRSNSAESPPAPIRSMRRPRSSAGASPKKGHVRRSDKNISADSPPTPMRGKGRRPRFSAGASHNIKADPRRSRSNSVESIKADVLRSRSNSLDGPPASSGPKMRHPRSSARRQSTGKSPSQNPPVSSGPKMRHPRSSAKRQSTGKSIPSQKPNVHKRRHRTAYRVQQRTNNSRRSSIFNQDGPPTPIRGKVRRPRAGLDRLPAPTGLNLSQHIETLGHLTHSQSNPSISPISPKMTSRDPPPRQQIAKAGSRASQRPSVVASVAAKAPPRQQMGKQPSASLRVRVLSTARPHAKRPSPRGVKRRATRAPRDSIMPVYRISRPSASTDQSYLFS